MSFSPVIRAFDNGKYLTPQHPYCFYGSLTFISRFNPDGSYDNLTLNFVASVQSDPGIIFSCLSYLHTILNHLHFRCYTCVSIKTQQRS